jgi:hypothetical protein
MERWGSLEGTGIAGAGQQQRQLVVLRQGQVAQWQGQALLMQAAFPWACMAQAMVTQMQQ